MHACSTCQFLLTQRPGSDISKALLSNYLPTKALWSDVSTADIQSASFGSGLPVQLEADGVACCAGRERVRGLGGDCRTMGTFAGTPLVAGDDDGAVGTGKFQRPVHVALSPDGETAFVSDDYERIRTVDVATGSLSTLVDRGVIAPRCLAVSPDGASLFVTDLTHVVHRVSTTGVILSHTTGIITTLAGTANRAGFVDGGVGVARFNTPWAIAVASDGLRLFVADRGNAKLRQIDTISGVVSTVAALPDEGANGGSVLGVAITSDGTSAFVSGLSRVFKVRLIDGTLNATWGTDTPGFADGNKEQAKFDRPNSIRISHDDRVLFLIQDHSLRAIDVGTGRVKTLLGAGMARGYMDGEATFAQFDKPSEVEIMPDGRTALIADMTNLVVRRVSLGCVDCPAGFTGTGIFDQCTSCAAGKFKQNAGTDPCTDCEAGKFSIAVGDRLAASGCMACLSGTYSNDTGVTTASGCLSCPSHSTSTAGSKSLSDCVCVAGFEGQPCTECLAGSHKSSDGTENCTACGLGTYQNATGSTVCVECEAGKYSNSTGSSACSQCTVGADSQVGSVACVCPKGEREDANGQCLACPKGKYGESFSAALIQTKECSDTKSPAPSCEVTFTGLESADSVSLTVDIINTDFLQDDEYVTVFVENSIHSISFIDGGADQACSTTSRVLDSVSLNKSSHRLGTLNIRIESSAAVGHFQCDGKTLLTNITIFPDERVCADCPVGTFSNLSSQTVCTACAAGKFLNSTGSDSEDYCLVCNAGTYSSTEAAESEASCQPCPANSHSAASSNDVFSCLCSPGYTGPGGESCAACAAGKYKGNIGSNECTSCRQGTYSRAIGAASATVCLNCTMGTYSSTPNATFCVDCVAGKHSTAIGSNDESNCSWCHAGTYAEKAATSCTNCTGGTFSGNAAGSCEQCPTGKISGFKSVNCSNCLAGKYSNDVGAMSCDDCLAGTFSEDDGSSMCTDCDAGKFSSDAASACSECEAGKFASSSAASCTYCLAGKFAVSAGTADCSACAAGKFSTVVGSKNATDCSSCLAGHFSADSGSSQCTQCPANSFSCPGSALRGNCSCNTGYTGSDGVCTPCLSPSVCVPIWAVHGGIGSVAVVSRGDGYKYAGVASASCAGINGCTGSGFVGTCTADGISSIEITGAAMPSSPYTHQGALTASCENIANCTGSGLAGTCTANGVASVRILPSFGTVYTNGGTKHDQYVSWVEPAQSLRLNTTGGLGYVQGGAAWADCTGNADCVGSGFAGVCTVDSNGAVTAIAVTQPGAGFSPSAPPSIKCEGGAGLTAVAVLGTVTAVTVTDGGSGYSPASLPSIKCAGGHGQLFSGILGKVSVIRVSNPGSGFSTSAPPVISCSGGASGSFAPRINGTAPHTTSCLASIAILSSGYNYTRCEC